MTNKELADLLRSAASALEHGRYSTARKKLKAVFREIEENCANCGSPKRADQSCGCFDNGSE